MVFFNFDWNEGLSNKFLTPVYFSKEVLAKYLYDSRIHVEFSGESYGSIHFDDFHIAFGINSDNAILAWLGDLEKLPQTEQVHWKSNNIEPQNNTKSEFYDAQIKNTFTKQTLAVQIINAIDSLNASFARKYSISIYKLNSFDEKIENISRFRRIILQSRDDFETFVNNLSKIVNESIDIKEVKEILNSNDVSFDTDLGGIKLLELVYKEILGDESNKIAPFFLLNDLRNWVAHNKDDKCLHEVVTALEVADVKNYEGILTALLTRLLTAAKGLEQLVLNN